jgi:hypothetical protein
VEYVRLVSAHNLGDSAKAAECRAIENPIAVALERPSLIVWGYLVATGGTCRRQPSSGGT